MKTILTTPDLQRIETPTRDDLGHALELLLHGDDPNADLWLEDDAGWALSVVPTGDLFLENVNEGGRYQTLGPLPEVQLLHIMTHFIQGELEAVRAYPWEEGED